MRFRLADNTGPLPVVRTSPLEATAEFVPIFAALESDWWVPKANLVSGSAVASAPAEPVAPAAADPAPGLSPERVRSRLAGFQRGVRKGRAVARGEADEDQGYPGAVPLGDAAARDIEKEDT
ncbi:hypothetical protein N5079_03015 [Planotetraspora sp. A-T 1434]|uniref:hypothetical protein n=1 Tax=Planotetraspora sp. A-T 1434 TaxID=2979219 RepID=UPI0021C201A3|nr:hypothetical protein [Planotetraspora sp. A-T 1434]MCT9929187.1 hypothetical protein [Planotetraspora sp. A-T 1434]